MTTQQNKHWWLYILKLEDGKYYIGITSKTPEIRMQEHLRGVRVAYWTAKYKPLEIIHREDLGNISKAQAEKYENKMTRAMMKERGLNNVRGGDLTDTKDYVIRFGWIRDKESWDDFVYLTILFLTMMALAVDKYVVAFIPGGVR